jgi:hypothetical protein
MRSLPVLLALLVLPLSAAPAQPSRGIRPPAALLARLRADLDPNDDLSFEDSLASAITVTRLDLNGDGVPELVVEGTRFCGSNCQRWIYRRLPGGGYVQVHKGGGAWLAALPARSHGWRDVNEYWHMSCCEGTLTRSVFDGRRYRWRDTRSEREGPGRRPQTVYHVSITPPEARGRRRLALDPVDAGGGLWISARYELCGRPGGRCGAPELRLSSPRLPAGRVCVSLQVTLENSPGRPAPVTRLCGSTTLGGPAPGRATRTLVMHPTAADWARLWVGLGPGLRGPGLPAKLQDDAGYAVRVFAGRLAAFYRVPCPPGYGCEAPDS